MTQEDTRVERKRAIEPGHTQRLSLKLIWCIIKINLCNQKKSSNNFLYCFFDFIILSNI